MKIRIKPWLLLPFLLAGCQFSRELPASEELIVSQSGLLQDILTAQASGAFKGNGSLTIESEAKGQRLVCRINYNARDTIRLELNTGFGYGLVNMWLTPDSLFITNRMTNQFIATDYRSDELMQLLAVPLSFPDIEFLFLGRVSVSPQSQMVNVLNERENLVYLFRSPEGAEKIWVSKELKKPVRVTRTNRSGQQVLEIRLQRYKQVGDRMLAHQIQIYRPGDNQKISLYFNSLEESDSIALPVTVPEKMERIQL